MARYITTKADFTLRKKHKKGSGSTIYENDYTTINPLPNAQKGEYVIGDSNFVFTTRLGLNGQKKHVRGKFIPNPSGSTEEGGAWTIDTIIDSGITDETKIRLKPNYTSLTDFACYGSAVKLIQGTINGVITDFPAEMYLSNEKIKFYKWNSGYGFDETKDLKAEETRLYNEYEIDITSENVQPESVYNPLRYFALCGSSYTYIEGNNVYEFEGFSVTGTALGTCSNGKDIWVDKLAEITLSFSGGKSITIKKYIDYRDRTTYYTYTGGAAGGHIRPKKTLIEEYFRNCDDFTAVLLDRSSKPIYSAIFETPYETDTGFRYDMKTYVWPTLNGGYNPDLSGPYYSYLDSLIDVAQFLDEYRTDNIWRSLTHEAIKTLDWTYISNTDGEIEDMSKIDTSRIEPIAKIYGRQFDDLKRYADAIKSINTITYNQKSNTPDYTLTDVLANAGWEVNTLHITTDKDICTDTLYSGLTSGYTAADANIEFMRRLKLNSKYLTAIKGTRKGLDTMLSMFGFKPDEYKISEYVYVFSGAGNYPSFCGDIEPTTDVKYPLADEVRAINKYKVNYNPLDPYGEFCGIPVVEVGSEDGNYVIPWYSQNKKYDDGLYFQMNGGWAKRKRMSIDLEIAPNVKEIDDWGGVVPLYTETQARLKFAKDFDELLQQAYVSSNLNDVFYVTDISKITTDYTPVEGEDMDDASHYFILLNKRLNQFLGFSDEGGYGWRNIKKNEYENNTTTAGTMVLYLESIKDDTAGNNPHVGKGLYDDGLSYVSGMSEIFNYSLINRNFIGIDDEMCGVISAYTFQTERQEDNRKCWFFTDDFAGTTNTLREGDVTEFVCNNEGYENEDILTGTNAQNKIGQQADGYFLSGVEIYNRTTQLDAFNPETKPSMEASANSIVNVKNLEIIFAPKVSGEYSGAMKTYIEDTVMSYLTQMMPSTTIWSWSMSGETSNKPSKIYQVIFKVTNGPADSIIYDGARSGANYSGAINEWGLNKVEFYEGDSIAYTAKKGNEVKKGGRYITGSESATIIIPIGFSTTLTFSVANNLTASTINYTVNGGEIQTLTNVTEKTVQPFKDGDVISWTAVCTDSQYKDANGSRTINGNTSINIYFQSKPKEYQVIFIITNEDIHDAIITYRGTHEGIIDPASTGNNVIPYPYQMGNNIFYTATCQGYDTIIGNATITNGDKEISLNFQAIQPDKYALTFNIINGPAKLFKYTINGEPHEVQNIESYLIQNLSGDNTITWEAKRDGYYPEIGETAVTTAQTINIEFDEPLPEPCLRITPTEYVAQDYVGSTSFEAFYYPDCSKEGEYEVVTSAASWFKDIQNVDATIEEGTLEYENRTIEEAVGIVSAKYNGEESNEANVTIPGKPADKVVTLHIIKESHDSTYFSIYVGLSNPAGHEYPTYSNWINTATSSSDGNIVDITFTVPAAYTSDTFSVVIEITTGWPDKVSFIEASGETTVTVDNLSLDDIDGQNINVLKYWFLPFCATIKMPDYQEEHIGSVILGIGERTGTTGTAYDIPYLTQYMGGNGEEVYRTTDPHYVISSSGWSTSHRFGFNDENRQGNESFWEKYEVTVALSSGREPTFEASDLLSYDGQTSTGLECTYEELNNSTWIFMRKSS